MMGALVDAGSNGCSSLSLRDKQTELGFPPFLLVDSEDCNSRIKAINAQHAGAKMVIIADDSPTATQHDFSSSGGIVNIPVVFISKELGQKLVDTIHKSGSILVMFEMPIPKSDQVLVEYHIDDKDTKLFQLVGAMKGYFQQFGTKVHEKIHLFRAAEEDSDKAITQEGFSCISRDYFHDFVSLFAENCAKEYQINSGCLKKLGNHFDSSVSSSFKSCIKGIKEKNVMEGMKVRSTISKSYISINDQIYHGSFKAENIFEAICGAFVHSPNNCLYLNNKFVANLNFLEYQKNAKTNYWRVWLLTGFGVLILLAVVGVGMNAVFRKIYAQVLSERVPEIVRESVTNYQTLKNNV